MIYRNACRRCRGSMIFVEELDAVCLECLQCGWTIDRKLARRFLLQLRKMAAA